MQNLNNIHYKVVNFIYSNYPELEVN